MEVVRNSEFEGCYSRVIMEVVRNSEFEGCYSRVNLVYMGMGDKSVTLFYNHH